MSTIYQCVYRQNGAPTHRCGEFNQGKRDRCKGCGASVLAHQGTHVLAHWRGDSRYTAADAVKTYASSGAADRAASKAFELDNQSDLVARWIPA
jgi:hypothetical protein